MNQPIHYGSLEVQERQRLLNLQETMSEASTRAPSVVHRQQQQLPPAANNVETLEIEEFGDHADQARRQHEAAQRQLELQRQLRSIKLPTQEIEVKHQLRQLGHVVTYFGEAAADRRERLRKVIGEFLMTHGRLPTFERMQNTQRVNRDLENQYFLYEGKEILRDWRQSLARESIHRAANRVERQRLRRLLVDALEEDKEVEAECRDASKFRVIMSQFADASGVSRGAISPDQQLFGTAGGSGECRIWNIDDTKLRASCLGHLTKAHSIAFHPRATTSLPGTSLANIATGSSDLSVRLWSLNLEVDQDYSTEHGVLQKSVQLKGHEDRVNKVLFHSFADLLLSCSHDRTWRMWDLERQEEILVQTGHSKAVYAGALHPDGSLFFSGDLGGTGMVWDLRTGKGILPIAGHIKGIMCADFSPNGYQLATGSDDNSLRIWDLRRRGPVERIPAHLKLISDVKFQPVHGRYLASCSYDGNVKIWNAREWSLQKVYNEHHSKITSLGITNDMEYMLTTAVDREFVVWKKSE